MSQKFNFPEICITEASAGSGKTYALAKRYVQLLLLTARGSQQSYKNILAITFTNKASFQMKARVIAFLKNIALGLLPYDEEKEFLEPLGISREVASQLAYELMESIIHHYHFFAVKTIDSFINALLAGCAFKIGLSARFKIQRNSADYLQLSLDQWIDKSYQDKKTRQLLDDFVHQYLFLENRSGWFPKEDLLEVLKTLFSEYNTYQKDFLTFAYDSKDLFQLKKDFLSASKEILGYANDSMNKGFHKSLVKFVESHPVSFDLDVLSTYFARPEAPFNKGAVVDPQLEKLWSYAHKTTEDLCLAESYGVFNPYVMIFKDVRDIFASLSSKEDILFLEELNKKAAKLIDGGISISELYYRLAVRFHHYLIDEFQDTSISQCQNLLPMLQEALSTGGSLFLVGDKKQAIYAFRGGESRLFKELPKELPNAPLHREFLNINRRSQKVIVDFNNLIFSAENIQSFLKRREEYYLQKKSNDEVFFSQSEVDHIKETFEHSHQESSSLMTKGYVQIRHIPGRNKSDREVQIKQDLLTTIKEVQSRFALKDIAVLTRTNSQVHKVTQWLLSEGIYAQSDRTSDIKNHPLVIELVDLLRFLNSPIDHVSFARFILGDIFPRATGIPKEALREFLFQCRLKRQEVKEFYLYKEFRQQYKDVWNEFFEDFFSQVGIYPAYELVISIYSRFRLSDFDEAQGFLMHFLELVKRQEEFFCDVESFITYFDELENEERFVPIASIDAVRVMTLHKAKGLEFPVVIVPFLEMTVQRSKGNQGGLSYVLDIEDEGMRMLRLKDTYSTFSHQLKERYEKEYKGSFEVELNNIYVALTRPIWELYAMIPERSGSSINAAQFLFPEQTLTMGEKYSSKKEKLSKEKLVFYKTSFDRQWVPQLKEEFNESSLDQVKLRQEGIVMHFCLAQILKLDQDPSTSIDQIIQKAKGHFGALIDEYPIKEKLRKFLDRQDIKRFFEFDEQVQVFCEQEIVNRFGDSKRLDRLIVFKDKIWIVDFKTSRQDEAQHELQMKEYKQLVSELYPGLNIEGFLVYLYE